MPTAYLNEFTQMCKSRLLSIWDLPYKDENAVHNCLLVLKATVLSQHTGQEVHEGPVLLRKLEAQGPDGLHYHNLELISNVCHEGANLQMAQSPSC